MPNTLHWDSQRNRQAIDERYIRVTQRVQTTSSRKTPVESQNAWVV